MKPSRTSDNREITSYAQRGGQCSAGLKGSGGVGVNSVSPTKAFLCFIFHIVFVLFFNFVLYYQTLLL